MSTTPQVVDLDILDTPAAHRLRRIKRAIVAGDGSTDRDEAATPQALAKAHADAMAEAEHQRLFAEGVAERARAAAALAKAQVKAVAEVRANLPVEPVDELDALTAKACTAIDELRAVSRTYAGQLEATKAVLRNGGVVEREMFGTRDGLDDEHHGHAHQPAVTIDGVLYSTQGARARLAHIARYAA